MSVSNLQNALDLLQNQEVDAAISTLEQTVEEIPAHLPAYVLLARAHELKKAWNDALRSWENAHFLMPNSPTVDKGRARALRRIEEEREAAERASAQRQTIDPQTTESPRSEDAPPPKTESSDPAPDAGEEDLSPQRPRAEEESDASTEAPGADSPASNSPSEEPDALSEFEKLRQQAEAEARQGGARPGMSAQQRLQQDREKPDPPSAASGDATPDEPASPADAQEQKDDVTGDLDRLIRELESARIDPRPDPDEEDAFDELPEPDLDDDIDDLVSETLARIYAAQEKYEEAARIYVKLASQEPTQARHHLENAADMQEKAKTQG